MAINISDINEYPYTYDFKGSERKKSKVAQFGDNYQERKLMGVHPINSSWDVTFNFTSRLKAQQFVELMRQHGEETYIWKPPLSDTTHRYVIEEWGISGQSLDYYEISCKMTRWYGN